MKTPMQVSRRALLVGVSAALAPWPAFAHHSYAMFDGARRVTLVGTVREFQWRNPHIMVLLAVENDDGQVVEWTIEGANPSSLSRRGWSRTAMKAGDKARAVVHPMRNGALVGVLVSLAVNGVPVGRGPDTGR